jgi:succinoglycan biosynthesis transport protein ExoP
MEREMDEISLREIIEAIWNGKWIILLVTAIAVATSGIFSFFIIDPVYEARTTILVNKISLEQSEQSSLQTYFEQVKNHAVMSKTIDQLGLQQKEISINGIRDKISAEIVKDTNLIRIKVSDKDSKLASDIANAVTLHFSEFMSNQSLEQLKRTTEYMIDQIDTELMINQSALIKVEEQLASTPEVLVTNKSLSEDAFLNSVASQSQSQSSAETGSLQMKSEETNPVYISLLQAASNLKIELTKLENKRNEMEQKVVNNELKIQESILVVSRAIEPETPVGPRKVLNIAISGVVGCMFSLFIVFFLFYWRKSPIDTSVNRRTTDNTPNISS